AAIATSSAGVAWALGYADGERISRGEMLAVVRRIASSVRVPVTADMEAGYGMTPEAAAETARGVIAAGAVGLNLEDGTNDGRLVDVALHQDRIRAMREAGAAAGVPLVINARTDEFERVGIFMPFSEYSCFRVNTFGWFRHVAQLFAEACRNSESGDSHRWERAAGVSA